MRSRRWSPGVDAASADRCARCLQRTDRCICAHIPRIVTRTRILVIRHVAERAKPSNTAHLASLALPNLDLVDYGAEGARFDATRVQGQGTLLLYPDGPPAGTDAIALARHLVVLDGTWHQARHMLQRTPALRTLPRLALPPPPVRERVRRPHHAGHMSTLEAIAAALTLIEGPAAAAGLIELFQELTRRTIAARTAPRR